VLPRGALRSERLAGRSVRRARRVGFGREEQTDAAKIPHMTSLVAPPRGHPHGARPLGRRPHIRNCVIICPLHLELESASFVP
jgi:hypothetical protein